MMAGVGGVARWAGAAAAAAAGVADSVPLQLSLLDAREETVATLAADVDGLDAIRSLTQDKTSKDGGHRLQEQLSKASMRGDADALRRCLARGADVRAADAWGQTPLHWAASAPTLEGAAPAVDVCLQSGASAGAQNLVGMTPLHWAAAWGRVPATRSLVKAGANRDATDVLKKTPSAMANLIRNRVDAARGGPEGQLAILRELHGPQEAA